MLGGFAFQRVYIPILVGPFLDYLIAEDSIRRNDAESLSKAMLMNSVVHLLDVTYFYATCWNFVAGYGCKWNALLVRDRERGTKVQIYTGTGSAQVLG